MNIIEKLKKEITDFNNAGDSKWLLLVPICAMIVTIILFSINVRIKC